MPPMKITEIGYGSGKIKSDYPNVLRVYLGEFENKSRKKNTTKKKKQ